MTAFHAVVVIFADDVSAIDTVDSFVSNSVKDTDDEAAINLCAGAVAVLFAVVFVSGNGVSSVNVADDAAIVIVAISVNSDVDSAVNVVADLVIVIDDNAWGISDGVNISDNDDADVTLEDKVDVADVNFADTLDSILAFPIGKRCNDKGDDNDGDDDGEDK